MMGRVTVYLSKVTFRARSGYEMNMNECRLVHEHSSDQVLAIIKAPFGSRVRPKVGDSGQDELLVRRSPWPWKWFFGGTVRIPAKYLVEDARRRAYGLSLVFKLKNDPDSSSSSKEFRVPLQEPALTSPSQTR